MSSSIDILVQLQLAQKYLYRYGGLILIFLGSIGSILNLIVFTQKTLRKNPCSTYFISYNIVNFIFIYSSVLFSMLNLGFSIDYSTQSLVICRARVYINIVCTVLSPLYLVFASIDRVLITSSNALTRRRSTRQFAYICIGIGTLFWMLAHAPILYYGSIIQIGPNMFICYFQSSVYVSILSYFSLCRAISALSLLIICGLWSIKNIRNLRKITAPTSFTAAATTPSPSTTTHSTSSKDRQLCFILLIDIVIYTLFSFAFAIYLIYQQITQSHVKNIERTQIETIVSNICQFSGAIPFCFSYYANLILSKTFRNEIKKIFSCQLH